MAKGYQANQERKAALNSFGKDLARRSKSKCEICESPGVSLSTWEVPPVPNDPDLDRCVFICDTCRGALENEKQTLAPNEWRNLANTIWSEVPAVQVCVVRLLRRLPAEAGWPQQTLDEAFLDEEITNWADQSS